MKATTESTTFTSMTKALIAIDCHFGSLGSVSIINDNFGCNIVTCFFKDIELKIELSEVLNRSGNIKHIDARQITKNDAGSYRINEPLSMYDIDRAG